MLKTISLNAAHRALAARMVEFDGGEVSVNYGPQIDEHHAARSDAEMFDVSYMLAVDLLRGGGRDFLHCTQASTKRNVLNNNAIVS